MTPVTISAPDEEQPAASLGRHSIVIDGVTYYATAWPALEALQMGHRLCEVFGSSGMALLQVSWGAFEKDPSAAQPTAAELADGKPLQEPPAVDQGGLMGAAPGKITTAKVAALLMLSASERCKPEALSALLLDSFKYVRADKVRIGHVQLPESVHKHFDEHFKGRLPHLFEAFSWVSRVSFTLPGADAR